MADATRHDALNATSVEPSAAPSAYAAKMDEPARKVDGSTKKKSSSRRGEELPHGERELSSSVIVLVFQAEKNGGCRSLGHVAYLKFGGLVSGVTVWLWL